MAVVNSPYVGIARGKLGDGVFYRSKANTVLRGYNPAPQNRRTAPQQVQRSLFSSAVKFFSRGVQNLFMFAFEGKRKNESDYNAFMRYNSQRGIYFGPQQNDNDAYPALGRWVMTRGSLGTLPLLFSEYGIGIRFTGSFPTDGLTTWGAISSALISSGLCQQGDFLTFLFIDTQSRTGNASAPVTVGSSVPNWILRQVTIDATSTVSPTEFGIAMRGNTASRIDLYFAPVSYSPQYIQAGTVVLSRAAGGNVYVSNSELQLNDAASVAYSFGRTASWQLAVLEAWSYEQQSILQGGISENAVSQETTYRLVKSFSTPIATNLLTDQFLQVVPAVSVSQLEQMIVLATNGDNDITADVFENILRVSVDGDPMFDLAPDIDTLGRFNFVEVSDVGPTWTLIDIE